MHLAAFCFLTRDGPGITISSKDQEPKEAKVLFLPEGVED